jgi:hypothetical protein
MPHISSSLGRSGRRSRIFRLDLLSVKRCGRGGAVSDRSLTAAMVNSRRDDEQYGPDQDDAWLGYAEP